MSRELKNYINYHLNKKCKKYIYQITIISFCVPLTNKMLLIYSSKIIINIKDKMIIVVNKKWKQT